MKRLAVLIAAAAMLLCGCDTPETGKPGANNNTAQPAAVTYSITPSSDKPAPEADIVYDRSGVSLKYKGTSGSTLIFEASNSNSFAVTLRSIYTQADGFGGQSIWVRLEANETAEVEFTPNKEYSAAPGVVKMRLYFYDENYKLIEDSISDVITLNLSKQMTLHADPLYTLICDTESVKLGLVRVQYRDDSNSVRLTLFAVNKTDKDLSLAASNTVCDHPDYTASFDISIPAHGKSKFNMLALTSNETLSAAELDSITFDLMTSPAVEALKYDTTNSVRTENVRISIPKEGRPEAVIPDTVQETDPFEEFIENELDEDEILIGGISSVPAFEDENVRIEYAGAAVNSISEPTFCRFFFKCTNKLSKQIALNPIGVYNGATAEFKCSDDVSAMSEKYISVRYSLPKSGILGPLTYSNIKFTVKYDDGHRDSEVLSVSDMFPLSFSEEPFKPSAPAGAKQVYSDGNCELYLVSADDSEKKIKLELFAVNKTKQAITVYPDMTAKGSLFGSIDLLPGTCAADTLSVWDMDDTVQLTAKDLEGTALNVTVYDTDGNILSEGEGSL